MFHYFSRSAVLLVDNKKLEEAVKGKTRDPLVQIRFKDLCKSAYAWRKMDLSLRYWAFSKTWVVVMGLVIPVIFRRIFNVPDGKVCEKLGMREGLVQPPTSSSRYIQSLFLLLVLFPSMLLNPQFS
ncbi:hypothetical protein EJB05_45912 [Eragrostis curvula]|uniref:Uncharacterized protein n=1 Tax=Eragrostis curvula TaxID=38414 RepID=A0A5J9TM61_9POAL|nr:hypothetical protein EJB05_45912 [Eragrostis curvula]